MRKKLQFSTEHQTVSDPVALLQQIFIDEYGAQIKERKEPIQPHNVKGAPKSYEIPEIKPYDQELAEID